MHKREFHFVARARVGWGKGDHSFFSLFGPAVRSQKILAVQSGGQKGRGLGERNFCPPSLGACPPLAESDFSAAEFCANEVGAPP